jgi:tetratricopeptide (TPR) repeat protein
MRWAFVFLLGCHAVPEPRVFASIGEPDGARLRASAIALRHAPASTEAHRQFITACVRAGARAQCDEFYTSIPQATGPALLALAFSEPVPAEARLHATGDPLHNLLLISLARFAADHGDLDRAKAALALADPSAEVALVHAAIDIAEGAFAGAARTLTEVTGGTEPLGPEQREYAIALGVRLSDRAATQDKNAVDATRRLLAEMPQIPPDDAVMHAETAAREFPQSSLLQLAVGLALLKALDEPGAAAAFERAKMLCPFDPEADFELARLHERRGRYARAVTYLERGLDIAPVWSKGLWKLSDVALLAREPAIASRAFARLKRLYPEDLAVDLGRARALLDGDDGPQALAILKQAAREHPADLRPQLALAKTALELQARSSSTETRKQLVGDAAHALKSAQAIDENNGEVLALAKAISQVKL